MDDVFLTTEEVLGYLQVNLRTVYRLIKAGTIPAIRVGRQWRFRKFDIDRWLEGQRSGASRAAEPDLNEALSQEPEGDGRRPRVLVVDDEASIRELLSKTLALAEYEVDTARDGHAAIGLMRNRAYDLLITDLKMPGMDGLALIREARRLMPTLPIVIITAYSTEASAIESVNLGVSGYLTKPFRITRILSTAARILGD